MASLIIENHENTSSILFSEFKNYSKSGSKSDELEKFSEFKVTGILSCFFKAIGNGSLSLRVILPIIYVLGIWYFTSQSRYSNVRV